MTTRPGGPSCSAWSAPTPPGPRSSSGAVPGWAGLLRDGGALGIAWNALVAPRAEAAAILAGAGLEVLDDGPYRAFEHRVDQAIRRDILIARRP